MFHSWPKAPGLPNLSHNTFIVLFEHILKFTGICIISRKGICFGLGHYLRKHLNLLPDDSDRPLFLKTIYIINMDLFMDNRMPDSRNLAIFLVLSQFSYYIVFKRLIKSSSRSFKDYVK